LCNTDCLLTERIKPLMKLSPFPGMDPFLERPAKWASVHTRLINAISDQLADALAPHFYVEIEERVILTLSTMPEIKQQIEPDVYLVRSGQAPVAQAPARQITTPTVVEAMYTEEIRQRYLEIRDTTNREVVTTLELLSPFNKAAGQRGRIDFLDKRQKVMASTVHWIEIDLLRAGVRPPEVANKSDYYTLLKRAGVFGQFEVWYIDLRDPLPTIAVPLRPPFADAALDLQEALADMYRRAHYAESIDYSAEIPPPKLSPADKRWAQQRIENWLQA
jgi:hypothetical protein